MTSVDRFLVLKEL